MQNLTQLPDAISEVPAPSELRFISHRLSAGFPSPATDYVEDSLNLTDYLVRNSSASFLFNVRGDSMRDAHIAEGDKVIVDRSVQPRTGDIVVAVVNGNYTIKRLYQRDSCVELHPENPDYPTITFREGDELQVWGVVVGLVRRYVIGG